MDPVAEHEGLHPARARRRGRPHQRPGRGRAARATSSSSSPTTGRRSSPCTGTRSARSSRRCWAAGLSEAAGGGDHRAGAAGFVPLAPERRAVAEEYYNLGNGYLAAGKVQRALSLFELAIRTDAFAPAGALQPEPRPAASGQGRRGDADAQRPARTGSRQPDRDVAARRTPPTRSAAYPRRWTATSASSRAARATATRCTTRASCCVRLGGTTMRRAPSRRSRTGRRPTIWPWRRCCSSRPSPRAQGMGRRRSSLERYLEWKPQSADVLLQLAAAYRDAGEIPAGHRRVPPRAALSPGKGRDLVRAGASCSSR